MQVQVFAEMRNRLMNRDSDTGFNGWLAISPVMDYDSMAVFMKAKYHEIYDNGCHNYIVKNADGETIEQFDVFI